MTIPEFIVSIRSLEHHAHARMDVSRAGRIPHLSTSTARVPDDAPVAVEVVLEPAHPGVLASGTVSTRWTGECARCLELARGTLVAEVRELFVTDGDSELTYPMTDETIDLEPLARDACMLELPLRPLCRPECKGLCRTCGANLNDGPCSCAPVPDPRWSGLEALREVR